MKSSRRTFLRGAAGALGTVSLALPLLPSLSGAQESTYPLRMLVFFSGNGTIRNSWLPTHSGGRITAMSPILRPLDRHRSKLMVVDNMEIVAANQAYQPKRGFHGHERGLGAILTGMPLNIGTMEAESGYAQGISVDNFLANRLGADSALGNMAVGLLTRRHGSGWYNRDTMSYLGDSDPKFMETDGRVLFSQIFGDSSGDTEAFRRLNARRRSVLDFLRSDLTRVEARISTEDRLRLANHHEAYRTLERQLNEPPPTCEEPSLSEPSSWTSVNQIERVIDFQFQQTVKALECDRARIVAMQFGSGLGGISLRAMDPTITQGWHSASHQDYAEWEDHMVRMNTYIAEKLATLLDLMDSVPEGDGTLLDHSIVLWVNELGNGNVHTYRNAPLVMAGGGNGFFKTGGAFVDVGGRSNNDLLISLCHAFGQDDVTQFGLPELSTGPLDALHA